MTDQRIHSLSVVGAGAVGSSLAEALFCAGLGVDLVVDPVSTAGRSAASRTAAAHAAALDERIAASAVVLVAVPDRYIGEVARAGATLDADLSHQVWLHTAGALPASALSPVASRASGIGGFHPAWAFPKGRVTPLPPGTAFAVDGDEPAIEAAGRLASALGGHTVRVPASVRPLYHGMCVLASNALIGLIAEAAMTLSSAGISGADAERLLVTLAGGAVSEAAASGLGASLTGPVQRGDAETVSRHLRALEAHPDTAALYRAATRAVIRAARAGGTDHGALDRIKAVIDDE